MSYLIPSVLSTLVNHNWVNFQRQGGNFPSVFFATICKSICISKCTSFKHVVFKYPIHSVFYVKSLYLTLKTYYFSVFFWQNFQTFLSGRKTAVDDYNFNSVTYHIKIMQYHAKLNQCCAYYLEVIEPQVLFATKSSSSIL